MAPIALLFVSNAIILLLIDYHSTSELYYLSQIEWFKSLNQDLNTLPMVIWSNITQLGEAMVLLPLIFVFTLNKKNVWKAIIFTVPVASLISVGLKRLTSIPRPAAIVDPEQMTVIGKTLIGHTSLPSGHTITIFAASIALLMTLYPSIKKSQDKLVLCLMLVLTMFISLSRVAVGAHWPLDLIIGAACGWMAGYSGVYLFNKASKELINSNVWNYIFICVFSILTILLFIRVLNFSINNIIILISLTCSFVLTFNLINQQRIIRSFT